MNHIHKLNHKNSTYLRVRYLKYKAGSISRKEYEYDIKLFNHNINQSDWYLQGSLKNNIS
jgi:hypothetical protein